MPKNDIKTSPCHLTVSDPLITAVAKRPPRATPPDLGCWHTPVAHCWSEPIHVRRRHCNVCRKKLDDTLALKCEETHVGIEILKTVAIINLLTSIDHS
ncbi:hypothetical protein E2C01_049578 [Portunus trituberculatus]|uniref:Uncharacterized protein n=1 Tax=Portunus trituberculatus TaxID=210409 RepID=A0A5B7GE36_PORTR|nr:hypothetical protein [Portunus trituberculatus]